MVPARGASTGTQTHQVTPAGSPIRVLFFVSRHLGDMALSSHKAARLLCCRMRSHWPLKNLGRCDFRAGPYPYPQQVSKVRECRLGKSAIRIRNLGKRIGSEGQADRVGAAKRPGTGQGWARPRPHPRGRRRQPSLETVCRELPVDSPSCEVGHAVLFGRG